MRRIGKKLFSIFVGISLLGCSVFCLSSCNDSTLDSTLNGLPYFENDMTYLKYGSYPQTVVTDKNIISNLDSITDGDSNGYYSYDNNEYAKLVADSFHESDGGNRKSVISDYALASGCCQLSKIFYPDNCGLWWLRSPLHNISDFASSVWDSGDVCLDMVYSSYEGVRPSLVISK